MAIFSYSSLLKTVRAVFRRAGHGVYIIHQTVYDGLQLVDAMAEQLAQSRDIRTSPGYHLDTHWGPYADVPRNAMDDEQMRTAVLIRLLALRTAGTANQLLYLIRYVLGEAAVIAFEPWYPKAWVIQVQNGDPVKLALVAPLLTGLATAGENGIVLQVDDLVWAPVSEHGPVAEGGWFASVHGPVVDDAGMAHAVQL